MDWSSFALGIVAAFAVSAAVSLLLAAFWPGGRDGEDGLP
jgi:predicted anti-sigma-YlaC factor YlaD